MNEQMQLLASQAWEYARECQNSPDEDEEDAYYRNFQEKFALLIVKECANIILNNDIEKQEDYGVNHPYFGGWERGVIDSCQIIKKHFGVEE